MCTVLVLSNLALAKRKVKEAFVSDIRLLTAEDEAVARDKFTKSGGVDIAVLDDELPDDAGEKMLSFIRKSGSETPVVMMGSKTESDRVLRCFALGADDYVEYGVSAELLRAKIHVLMRRG